MGRGLRTLGDRGFAGGGIGAKLAWEIPTFYIEREINGQVRLYPRDLAINDDAGKIYGLKTNLRRQSEVLIYDLETGDYESTNDGFKQEVRAIAFDPNSQSLITACPEQSGPIRIHRGTSPSYSEEYTNFRYPACLAIDPTSGNLIVGHGNSSAINTISICDGISNNVLETVSTDDFDKMEVDNYGNLIVRKSGERNDQGNTYITLKCYAGISETLIREERSDRGPSVDYLPFDNVRYSKKYGGYIGHYSSEQKFVVLEKAPVLSFDGEFYARSR